MRQLIVFCEGRTEQHFCNQVLQSHLFPRGEGTVQTHAVGEKNHHHVFGLRGKYEKPRRFILRTIKSRQARNVYFTTLIDLYGLPRLPGQIVARAE